MSKCDILYVLIRSEPVINEEKYIFDSNNETNNNIMKVRRLISIASPFIQKKERSKNRKRLYEIEHTQKTKQKIKK